MILWVNYSVNQPTGSSVVNFKVLYWTRSMWYQKNEKHNLPPKQMFSNNFDEKVRRTRAFLFNFLVFTFSKIYGMRFSFIQTYYNLIGITKQHWFNTLIWLRVEQICLAFFFSATNNRNPFLKEILLVRLFFWTFALGNCSKNSFESARSSALLGMSYLYLKMWKTGKLQNDFVNIHSLL